MNTRTEAAKAILLFPRSAEKIQCIPVHIPIGSMTTDAIVAAVAVCPTSGSATCWSNTAVVG
jgi:hypothetical protein